MSADAAWVPAIDSFEVRLVLVRHQMGWNAKQAAVACGIKPQSWREWEMFRRRPRDYEAVCRLIAGRTGCDLVWLMCGQTPPGGSAPSRDRTYDLRIKRPIVGSVAA
jgi:hypothetical protein